MHLNDNEKPAPVRGRALENVRGLAVASNTGECKGKLSREQARARSCEYSAAAVQNAKAALQLPARERLALLSLAGHYATQARSYGLAAGGAR